MSNNEVVRVLRVLEYVGTRKFIDDMLDRRGVKGHFTAAHGVIREAVLGSTQEILDGFDNSFLNHIENCNLRGELNANAESVGRLEQENASLRADLDKQQRLTAFLSAALRPASVHRSDFDAHVSQQSSSLGQSARPEGTEPAALDPYTKSVAVGTGEGHQTASASSPSRSQTVGPASSAQLSAAAAYSLLQEMERLRAVLTGLLQGSA